MNESERDDASQIKIEFPTPENWEITQISKGITDNGSDCFVFNINSPYSESQLVIEFYCVSEWGSNNQKTPVNAQLIKAWLDYYKGFGEGSKFTLREKLENSSYVYGQSDSQTSEIVYNEANYERFLDLSSANGLNNNDRIRVIVKAVIASEGPYASQELAVFDKIVSDLYFEPN